MVCRSQIAEVRLQRWNAWVSRSVVWPREILLSPSGAKAPVIYWSDLRTA